MTIEDLDFSQSDRYARTLHDFRQQNKRNPKPSVFCRDREFWNHLLDLEGERYARSFEAWMCS